MSETQHQVDVDDKLPHIQTGRSTGGACLNRHIGDKPYEGSGNSCSHRWQAYLQMQGDSGLYNWPKYKSLSKQASRITTAAETVAGAKFPDWYVYSLKQPEEGDWDVDGNNFWTECYVPYWHEAHHIVPNSTLREAIASVGSKLVVTVRRGLLQEKYNLNQKKNMVMLPMDKAVANAIGLPRHRVTASCRSHSTYSNHVKTQLNKMMQKIKDKLDAHKKPSYASLKDDIVALSENLYSQITASTTSQSLDAMGSAEFVF